MSIHELQARLRALDEAKREADKCAPIRAELLRAARVVRRERARVINAARRVAEQAGEPSADALVEAIQTVLVDHGEPGCAGCAAVDDALAKHKENTDGR